MKILLLEDDPILGDLIFEHLQESNNKVTLCIDGDEAINELDESTFDILILDINVPNKSGIDVLKDARDFQKSTPAIFITAYRDTEHLKEAFSVGCDDYIKKPFDLEELDERIKNIKKRYQIESDFLVKIGSSIIFDTDKRVLIKDGKNISISLKESEILKYFLTHKNKVISTNELVQNIWDYDEFPSEATLRVYIKNLRKLFGKDSIRTVRGIGYSFEV